MVSQKILRTMNLTTASMLVGAVGVGLWGWLADGHHNAGLKEADGALSPGRPLTSVGVDAPARPTSAEMLLAAEFWMRPLQAGFQIADTESEPTRKPLMVESSPQPPTPQRATVLDLGLRLVGTVVEQGKSMAIAIDRQGKLDFRAEGEAFELVPEGVLVNAVLADSIRVSFEGKDAIWRLGQSLTFETAATVLPAKPVDAAAPRSRQMSILEELNSLNGDLPADSF